MDEVAEIKYDGKFHSNSFNVEPGTYDLTMTYGPGATEIHCQMHLRRVLIADGCARESAVQYRRSVFVGNDRLVLANRSANFACAPKIRLAPMTKTVFLAGDSTVCDQVADPWWSWGQMLPCFLGRGAAVLNCAQSGKSAQAFVSDGLLSSILNRMKADDVVLFQFGHNDQKIRVDAIARYEEALEECVIQTRGHKGIPMIVTPVQRAHFERDGTIKNTLGDFPFAARELSARLGVDCVDLTARSTEYLTRLGPLLALPLFVHAPPGQWPSHPHGIKSRSHHSMHGAYEMAKCVASELRRLECPLRHFIEEPPAMKFSGTPWLV